MNAPSGVDINPLTSTATSALWSLQGRGPSSPNGLANTGNGSPASIPQTIFTNPAVQPSSVINLSNSTDVVIGQMSQYQGPVVIYQYMDATVEARSMQANGGIDQSRNATSTSTTQILRTRTSKVLYLLVLLVTVVAGVVIYLELKNTNSETAELGPILFGNNYEQGTFPNLGNGHLVIDRAHWGASNLAKQLTIPLYHPTPYVVITHIGAKSIPCTNIRKCSTKMRILQDSAISENHYPDISANFYVGDDGNIYVGRGWDWANAYANNTLAIGFLSDYKVYTPSEKQLDATHYLLAYALANSYLKPDYHLVAQNQTKSTQSPGVNVYAEIKKWPRFYDCGMNGKPKCGSELGMPPVWDANQ